MERKSSTAASLRLWRAIWKPRNHTLMVPNFYIEPIHKLHRFIDSLIVVNAFDDFRHANKMVIRADRKNAIFGHFFPLLSGGSTGTLTHRRLTEKDAPQCSIFQSEFLLTPGLSLA